LRGLRATATPATRSPPARLCLICRPRDDFLDKEKRLLGEPACRSRSAARPRWRPWHGPCSAHDAVWTGGAHPTSSRLCEKRLHLSSQAASALGGPRAAHNRRSKDLQILIRIRPDFRERLALSRHIDLHANQVPQLTFWRPTVGHLGQISPSAVVTDPTPQQRSTATTNLCREAIQSRGFTPTPAQDS
jgi:hypothetical protein